MSTEILTPMQTLPQNVEFISDSTSFKNYYTVSDIEALLFSGFKFDLPVSTKELLQKLENEIQIENVPESLNKKPSNNDSNKKQYYKRPDTKYNRQAPPAKDVTTEDWQTLRTFKTTKIDKKEGVDKHINDIRILLNKISVKNYETQKESIVQIITDFLALTTPDIINTDVTTNADIAKLSKTIFDIISTNKFFSELYAKLYKELTQKFSIFNDILIYYLESFKDSIHHVHYIDPNADYDGFCLYTKQNDNRKATTMFIVNIFKLGILDIDLVLNIIQYFVSVSLEYIDSENRTNEVEEITENIFLFVSNCQNLLSGNEKWKEHVLPDIIRISLMKMKEHKSLSNRIVFKYMDIIDSME